MQSAKNKRLIEESLKILQRNIINIPDVFEYLDGKSNIVLCGGGKNECLKEIEIILMIQNTKYNLLNKFVY